MWNFHTEKHKLRTCDLNVLGSDMIFFFEEKKTKGTIVASVS